MMDIPILLRGLSDVIDRYDTILFDQFGVLHNGATPYEGAVEAVREIASSHPEKSAIILSNTSKRSAYVTKLLNHLGFDSGHFSGVVSSGELAWDYILRNYRGKSCTWFSWDACRRDDYLNGLDVKLSGVDSADFLLFHGSQRMVTSLSEHDDNDNEISLFTTGEVDSATEEVFRRAILRGIPAICANMDHSAITASGLRYMPGLLMESYRSMGGQVISFGKPMKEYFDAAIELYKHNYSSYNASSVPTNLPPVSTYMQEVLRRKLRRRIVHIGDSIHHDIAGAHAAGIDSILVTKHGVHASELYPTDIDSGTGKEQHFEVIQHMSGRVDEETYRKSSLLRSVMDLCDREGIKRPTYVIERVNWG